MTCGDFKDLNRRTDADNVLRDKVFKGKNPKYGGYQHGLASFAYKYFDKKLHVEALGLKINLQSKMKPFLINN